MSYTLIHNGTLIDGRGGEPVRQAAVLIGDNKIQQAGRKVDMALPDATIEMIDAQKGTILPGLIDTHVHFSFDGVDLMKRLTSPFSLQFYNVIVVAPDPLADIRSLENMDNIKLVLKDGRIVKDKRS